MKLDRGYWTPGDYLRGVTNFSGDIRYNPQGQTQMQGALQPFAELIDTFTATLKPYHSEFDIWLDITRFLKGIALIFAGTIYACVAAGLFTALKVYSACGGTFKKAPPTNEQMLSWGLVGLASIVTGIVELAFTPISWLRIPFRLALTAITPAKRFEEKPTVQALVASGREETSVTKKADICLELHRKFKNALSKNHPTELEKEEEKKIFRPIKTELKVGKNSPKKTPGSNICDNYLQFFHRDPKKLQQDISKDNSTQTFLVTRLVALMKR